MKKRHPADKGQLYSHELYENKLNLELDTISNNEQ